MIRNLLNILSGCGKTTLLNAITFKTGSELNVEGNRMINGSITTSHVMSSISSYVQQDDLFFGTMTSSNYFKMHIKIQLY